MSNTKLTPEKSGYKQSIEFSFDFAVPESAKKGDTTVISLPNELTFQRNESFDVYAPDGQKVAKAVADTRTKKLTITYTDYVDKKNDITGHMAFNVVVDSNVVKKAQEVSATIMINGSSPSITIGGGKINYLGPTGEPDTLNFGNMERLLAPIQSNTMSTSIPLRKVYRMLLLLIPSSPQVYSM